MTKTGLTNGFVEVAKHPSTLAVPFQIRKFSSLQTMIDGGVENFPAGRVYLSTDQNEFGFGQKGEVETARSHGIRAEMLNGYHNQPMLHPREASLIIGEFINSL